MGVRGEFKAANPAPNSNAKDIKKDIPVETAPKRDYKDDVIEDLNNDLKKLQKSLTCVICLEMLFEPYALQCGHVFCYTCMLDWLDQDKKMTCPECRSVVKIKPAPAYLIRDMIEVFVLRAELSSPNGNGIELRKQQKEALKIVEKDKATEGSRGGLFRGLFRKKKKLPRVVQDPEDGVLRCPRCNWEIMDDGINRCERCELRFRPLSRHGDFSDEDEDDDEDDSGSETESDRGGFGGIHPSFFESSEEEDWRPGYAVRDGIFARPRFGDDEDDDEDDDDHDNEEEEEEEDEEEEEEEEEEDAQYEDRMRDSSELTGGRDGPIILEDGSDTDEATRNVRRPPRIIRQARGGTRHRAANFTETSDDEGSLADFIEHDTPENQRRPGRSGVEARSFFSNSPVVISSSPAIIAPTRRNPRRTVIDDEEEDNQSSISEASSVHPRRGYTQRRGPIALPSDSGDDEIRNVLGYAPLDHTASENEDDSFASPPSGGVNIASHSNGPGSVFSVPEEDEEDEEDEDDESRAFGDDDESEDQDGDVRMGGSDQRSRAPGGQRATRNRTRGTRPHVIEGDSDSDSDVPTTRRRRIQATGTRSNYLRTNHRDSNSSRRQREIDPAFLNMFQQHSQAITEGRLESLGSMNQSVSPARSATPVQRNYTGGSSNRATRSTRESTRESRESTRELTPVQSAAQSSPPPPFSPIFQGINSTLASGSPAPSSPAASSNPQIQSPRPGTEARAGSESANNQTSLQSPRPVPITIGASPQASRMRTRNSRQQLRGASSRSGLRPGSATATPTILQSAQPQGVAGTAAASGRQQSARPILTAAASRGRRGVPLTTEDIRARGEATLRRQRQEAAESASGLGRRSSRRNLSSNTTSGNGASAPTPLVTVGRIGSSTLQGNGRRVGAVIGGAPGQGAGGGPMLIIDNGED